MLREPETYFASTEDSVPAEADGVHVTFPHTIGSFAELLYTPFGDELTLDFARAAVAHEALGADSIPDLLWVSCSSGDYVGHRYGTLSMEIEDYYLRLDGYLGDFFAFLDQRVGAGRYTVVLTGDHGGLPLPEQLARRGFPSRRLLSKEATAAFWTVEASLATELGRVSCSTRPPRRPGASTRPSSSAPRPPSCASFPSSRTSTRRTSYPPVTEDRGASTSSSIATASGPDARPT